jgi:hypothetical protein
MTVNLHFSEQRWQQHENNWRRWWAGDLPRPMVMIESPYPLPRRVPEELTAAFLMEKEPEAVLDHYQAQLEGCYFYGDAWPKWWTFFGPGVMAAFLGADMLFAPSSGTIWFEPPHPIELQTANLTYDAQNSYWQRIQTLTRLAVERWGNQVSIGFTDLGGNLDILASLRNAQTLLFDTIDQPEAVSRVTQRITELWLRYYDEQYAVIQAAGRGSTPWAAIWSPGRCYMFQSDLAYMISTGMFEKFVLPDLDACCARMDHAFYHLDGKGQIRHLDMLLALDKLHGIQWIPGDGQPPPEAWLPLLKRIREAGKLCQLYVTATGAHTIVKELGGRGFALYINESMAGDEAEAFLATLARDDISS